MRSGWSPFAGSRARSDYTLWRSLWLSIWVLLTIHHFELLLAYLDLSSVHLSTQTHRLWPFLSMCTGRTYSLFSSHLVHPIVYASHQTFQSRSDELGPICRIRSYWTVHNIAYSHSPWYQSSAPLTTNVSLLSSFDLIHSWRLLEFSNARKTYSVRLAQWVCPRPH